MTSALHVLTIPTPTGPARAHVHAAAGRHRSTFVLGHGAGGGIDARDLAALAAELPARGHAVVLVEAPWRVAGKKVATAPPTLDTGWLAVLAALRESGELGSVPLVTGGRSAGARVACRTATATGADAVFLLAFPLHPPGRPEKSRADELVGAGVPAHVVQGERDPFGGAAELRAAAPGAVVTGIPCADHGLKIPARAPLTQGEALDLVVRAACAVPAEWAPEGGR